ncbi:hypothetical protein LINPERPRIM_LOCUS32024 [Linum perenne]
MPNALLDLGYQGDPFTWSNEQRGSNHIKERLDRALANGEWRLQFDRAMTFHESRIGSDHRPIRINLYGIRNNSKPPFRFDSNWLANAECKSIILANINQAEVGNCHEILQRCSNKLATWAKQNNPNFVARIQEIKGRLEAISRLDRTEVIVAEETNLLQELDFNWASEERK